jgi:hypothetical protein
MQVGPRTRALLLVGAIVVGTATVVAAAYRWLPDQAIAAPHQPEQFYLEPDGPTSFVTAGTSDSADVDFWTTDGRSFYAPDGRLLMQRSGDDLVSSDGTVLLHITREGRVLVRPSGGPPEVELKYYNQKKPPY